MLIVGLGNPGRRYENTRHNVGFMVVDHLSGQLSGGTWRTEHHAAVRRVSIGDQDQLLVKPETFMNSSGQAVSPLADKYRVQPARTLVISDDLDLPFGRIRLRPGGSPGGHNGLRSISTALATQDFPRLRIGIGRPVTGDPLDWVLAPFATSEAADLPHICAVAADIVIQIIHEGLLATMNAVNGRGDVREPIKEPARRLHAKSGPENEHHG